MKFKIILSALLSIIIFTTSCQKELDGNDIIPPPPSPVDSVKIVDSSYLDKLYDLTSNGAGFDTVDIATIYYDNLKRVISINDSDLTAMGMTHNQSFYYSYNGTDTLPYKSVQITTQIPGSFDTLTSYHFYDTQQRNLKDSIIGADHSISGYQLYKIVTSFSYASGKLYGQTAITDIIPASVTTFARDTADIDANGDILLNKKYDFDGTNSSLLVVSNFAYDSHLNPFAKIGIYKAHKEFPNGETLIFEYLSYNNIISQNENTDNGSNINNWTFAYTYNAAGLPIIQTINYGGGSTDKIIFKYKAL